MDQMQGAAPKPADSPRVRPGMRVKAVCAALGVSKGTVHNMLNDGRLDGVKVGRMTIVRSESVERLLSSAPKRVCGVAR